jgi:hypothetical protein
MVNQDAETFSVWQANTAPKTPELVAVDKANNVVSEFCADSTGPKIPPPSPTIAPPQKEDSKLSGGAIGGIVAGAVAGLAILSAIGFFLYRRRRSSGATAYISQDSDLHLADVKPPSYSVAQAEPQELAVSWNSVTELDGRAVNGSRY